MKSHKLKRYYIVKKLFFYFYGELLMNVAICLYRDVSFL